MAEKGTPLQPEIKAYEFKFESPPAPEMSDVASAKKQVRELMEKEEISPQQLIILGQMAQKSISDPALFQLFKQQMIANDIADEEDLAGNNGFRFLAIMTTLGKMVQQMISSGELRG